MAETLKCRRSRGFHPSSERVSYYVERLTAADENVLLMDWARLPIAAMEPSASRTTSSAYSVRSWASSPFQRRDTKVVILIHLVLTRMASRHRATRSIHGFGAANASSYALNGGEQL